MDLKQAVQARPASQSRRGRFHRSPSRDARAPAARLGIGLLCLLASVLLASHAAAAGGEVAGVVNINTASAEELQLLPGVGRVRADAILATRKERGRFESIDDLESVKGIGPSMLGRIRPHVSLQGKTTARLVTTSKPGQSKAGSGPRR